VDVADPTIAKDSEAAVDPTIIRSRLVKIDWDILAVAEDSSGLVRFGGRFLGIRYREFQSENLFYKRERFARFLIR